VENNKWAIGMAHERASSQTEIYKKASVFGMPGYEVDGMDVLAVRSVAEEAVRRARAGEGPTLIEALTYRFRGHSLADPDELRSKEDKDAWQARDPIKALTAHLIEQGLANQQELKDIDRRITALVEEAVEFAINSPEPDPADLYKYVFAED
jgi:pyruvate dehydrogenase E1 component alpha subunit